ncbi:MAG: hypothetical protein F4213_15210 [Boseongicola sp. SB0677_bin_26]|nr:hypothetical protein [Boseongicola sp. SB0665_bin_10]MYG27348.1 hypothetical protein [Boseongicola sp. SB0677_bin_26]
MSKRASMRDTGDIHAPELFGSDAVWAPTTVLDAQALAVRHFDLDEFARYRCIRILTYSASVPMLASLLEQFEEASVEVVMGHSRTVNDMAALIALQTVAMEDVRKALQGISVSRREGLHERIRSGRLRVWVVEGHVSHAKIFLLSDGPDGGRSVLTGSANFSTSALLGDQHEVLMRFNDDLAWDHFEDQYRRVRDHASAELPLAKLAEDRRDPAEGMSPVEAPVLAPDRGLQVIQIAKPVEAEESVERGRRLERIYDLVLPALRKEKPKTDRMRVRLDDSIRKRFSGMIRRQTRGQAAIHPTFSLDLDRRQATVCGADWPLDSEDGQVSRDAEALATFWETYGEAFRGDVGKLQKDYFVFLCWMFFSPLICTLRRQAALEDRDVIRYPRVGIIYGKSNSGKTQLVDIAGKFMFADDFPNAVRTPMTGLLLREIDASYRRMPAFFDDMGWRRFRDHAPEFIKDETLPPHGETPCMVVSMNARVGAFPDEVAKRCLLIYSSASLPSEDEDGRIAMADRLATIEPTTHLYRRYLRMVLDRIDVDGGDWLRLSSEVLSGILIECGHDPAWAGAVTWQEYASTRYDALREQLRSLLDPARRQASRPATDSEGWFAEGGKVWIRVGTNSFGHPDFEWRDLPTYMLHEHESRAAEFVLDVKAVENFLGARLVQPRWRIPFRLRSVR